MQDSTYKKHTKNGAIVIFDLKADRLFIYTYSYRKTQKLFGAA